MGESLKFSFTRGTRFGWVIRLAVLCLAINIVLLWHMSWDNETSGVISPYTSQSEARVSKRRLRRDSNSRGVAGFLDSYGPPLPVTESKRWPSLTNGRPWEVAYQTGCEAYYGNGFFKLFTFSNLKSDKPAPDQPSGLQAEGAAQWGEGVPGWFRCRQNSALSTSICEGGRVAMHTARVHMSRGGEPVGSVVGRTENEELPSFDQGAFEILAGEGSLEGGSQSLASDFVVDALLPQGHIAIHVTSKVLNAMRVVPTINCTQVVTEPTLFVARYEYANLFHTTTDWYSAYVTARVSGFDVPPRVVFLDGHAQSPLDDCWRALFPSITLAKQLEGTVCFEHAMFVPLGYTTAMFEAVDRGNGAHCVGCAPGAESGGAALLEAKEESGNAARGLGEGQLATARLREFGEVVSRVWGGDHRPWSWAHWKPGQTRAHFGTPLDARETDLHVLFVRREDYLAHPRHAGQVEKRLDNEEEVLVALRFWAAEWGGVREYREIEESVGSKKGGGGRVVIENGLLAHMTFKEQITAVHRAAVIVGAHGAGMTHLLFARPGTEIVEIVTPLFQRPHFERLSAWRGDVHYQSIQCTTQSVEPAEVVTAIRSIATRLLGLGQPPSLQARAG